MCTAKHGVSLDEMAKMLHAKMEHLDPTDRPEWDGLTDHERDFYRICVRTIAQGLGYSFPLDWA